MSAKFVARPQVDGGGKRPVLLRSKFDAGHGFVSNRKDWTYLWADIYTFLMWQLEVKQAFTSQSYPLILQEVLQYRIRNRETYRFDK